MAEFGFKIEKKIPGALGRAGLIQTAHGPIETPAFIVVGTKATVKAITPDQVKSLGASAILANTYHLYLEPGAAIVEKAGGLNKFMNWSGPTITDSGGFQVFSLGAAFGSGGVSKLARAEETDVRNQNLPPLAKIDADGVTFRSHLDGSEHRFTPERSIEIQHQLGADIIFAFDECTSPQASYQYQREALERTHAWASRSVAFHKKSKLKIKPALFGIVQGGRHRDLREESARAIADLDFSGFGIGGSFDKKDLDSAVGWVNQILPEEKPRHLLGIGAVEDILNGIEQGCDTFDCVAPTRLARTGVVETKRGRRNLFNARWRRDFAPVEADCHCYTCQNYTTAYLAHLFRAKEILSATLASIHNLYFFVNLVKASRQAIIDNQFTEFKTDWLML